MNTSKKILDLLKKFTLTGLLIITNTEQTISLQLCQNTLMSHLKNNPPIVDKKVRPSLEDNVNSISLLPNGILATKLKGVTSKNNQPLYAIAHHISNDSDVTNWQNFNNTELRLKSLNKNCTLNDLGNCHFKRDLKEYPIKYLNTPLESEEAYKTLLNNSLIDGSMPMTKDNQPKGKLAFILFITKQNPHTLYNPSKNSANIDFDSILIYTSMYTNLIKFSAEIAGTSKTLSNTENVPLLLHIRCFANALCEKFNKILGFNSLILTYSGSTNFVQSSTGKMALDDQLRYGHGDSSLYLVALRMWKY